jgi:hypothetical protein
VRNQPNQSLLVLVVVLLLEPAAFARERISINDGWRFTKGDPTNITTSLLYDVRQQHPVRRLAEAEADGNSSANAATTDELTGASTNLICARI